MVKIFVEFTTRMFQSGQKYYVSRHGLSKTTEENASMKIMFSYISNNFKVFM